MVDNGGQRDTAPARDKERGPSALTAVGSLVLAFLIAVLLTFLFLPLIPALVSRIPLQLLATLNTDTAYQALLLSLETTLVSLLIIVIFGMPLAYGVKNAPELHRNTPRLHPVVAGQEIMRGFGYEPTG